AGETLVDHKPVESRNTFCANFFRIGNFLARLENFGKGRWPDIGRIDIAPLPGGNDLRRRHVEDFRIAWIDLPDVVHAYEKMKVGGRDERHADLLALEIFRLLDA